MKVKMEHFIADILNSTKVGFAVGKNPILISLQTQHIFVKGRGLGKGFKHIVVSFAVRRAV